MNNKQIEVSPELAQTLSAYHNKFNTLFETQKLDFNRSSHLIYYLVSTKFIREWLAYCHDEASLRTPPNFMN